MARHVVVIGLGYVGLPLVVEAVQAGYRVTGLDSKRSVVEALNQGRSHVDDISDAALAEIVAQGFRATADPDVLADADVCIICVPTPLTKDGGPDLGAVAGAATSVAKHLHRGQLVVLESTTWPGTTNEVLLPLLEEGGMAAGEDFYLAFSPERIDPGNSVHRFKNTPKVVGGVNPRSTDAAIQFYSDIAETVVPAKGATEAEMAKLLENTYRHVNIALVNEMAKFSHELGIDIWDVIRCASTKPFGFQTFFPGPGVGGHCIPIDPNYLSYRVRAELGYPFRFVELAQEINSSMPRYVAQRAAKILNGAKKAVNGSTILLLGVTYKANIGDQRESPAIPLAEELQELGARLWYHDPYVCEWEHGRAQRIVDLDRAVASADITVLLQPHQMYDVERLAERSRAFFDTRGLIVGDSSSVFRL